MRRERIISRTAALLVEDLFLSRIKDIPEREFSGAVQSFIRKNNYSTKQIRMLLARMMAKGVQRKSPTHHDVIQSIIDEYKVPGLTVIAADFIEDMFLKKILSEKIPEGVFTGAVRAFLRRNQYTADEAEDFIIRLVDSGIHRRSVPHYRGIKHLIDEFDVQYDLSPEQGWK